ncbi:hypothetical protein [Pseudarthrobacter sp. Y6]|uniref:hypothetical protein n=1 Tax=Pseudarthrobacter sp. Y6 TaxID=3418422 RepID=UPI003CE8886D
MTYNLPPSAEWVLMALMFTGRIGTVAGSGQRADSPADPDPLTPGSATLRRRRSLTAPCSVAVTADQTGQEVTNPHHESHGHHEDSR